MSTSTPVEAWTMLMNIPGSPSQTQFWQFRTYFSASFVDLLPATAALYTHWYMFRIPAQRRTKAVMRYTSIMTSHITKCVDDMVITKTIKSFPYYKVWMNGEVEGSPELKVSALFLSDDKEGCKTTKTKDKGTAAFVV